MSVVCVCRGEKKLQHLPSPRHSFAAQRRLRSHDGRTVLGEHWSMKCLGEEVCRILAGVHTIHSDGSVFHFVADVSLGYSIVLGRRMIDGLGALLRIGKHRLLQRLSGFLTTKLDVLIISKVLPLESLGIYDMSKRISFLMPETLSPKIDEVFYSYASSLHEKNESISRLYFRFLLYSSIIAWLFVLFVHLFDA